MTENLDSNGGGGAEKRRSTRVMHSASITVKGTDTLGQPFRESTKTVMVNCNGCQYQGIRYPAPSSSIMLEVRHRNPRRPPRVVPARVIWVRRPQAYRALYHVGIEFEVAGNVWDIDLPPADWFPCAEDEELVIPVASEENIAHPNQFVLSASVADVEHSGRASEASADASILSARSTGTLLLPEEQRPVVAAGEDSMASQADRSASIMEMVRMFTAEAVAGEIVRIREFIDAELRGAIDKAFERLSERIASAPSMRQAVPESSISETKVSEVADQISEESELRGSSEPGRMQPERNSPDCQSAACGETRSKNAEDHFLKYQNRAAQHPHKNLRLGSTPRFNPRATHGILAASAVSVAQLVEHRSVAPRVAGSNPVAHPNFFN